jgi:sialate O-acetylesterase
VSVSIAGQTKKTAAGADGKWRVQLDPLKAAEGLTLTVKGTNTIEVKDVLVGEVWLGSGQSNMAGAIRSYKVNDPALAKTLAAAPYPRIRLIRQGGAGWQLATPENVDGYSAILFAFGARLQGELDVPVGLLLGAVGGTPSGYWLTEEMYRSDAACQAQAKEFAATYDLAAATKNYERLLAAWKVNADKAKAAGTRVGRAPAKPSAAGECTGKIGHLYVAHVQPFAPFAIRGVLWDQGESGTAITGVDQFHVMGALIKGWRKDWQQDFPFLCMQKTSGGGTAWDLENPTTSKASPFAPLPAQVPRDLDGLYRETHLKIQQHPKTAMVTSTDLGGGTHPVNKSGYADRAVRVAMGFVYGRKIETSGPLYASHTVEGSRVRVKFSHVGQGLAARHSDKVQGFMIAGADKKFVWADAAIDGASVIVSSPAVPKPASVRYAWSGKSPWANLFNQDGLPAQTFRTDDWK